MFCSVLLCSTKLTNVIKLWVNSLRIHRLAQIMISLQWSHFNDLTSMILLQWSHFNDLTSMISLQWSHFNDLTSMILLQWSYFNDLTSMISLQWSYFNDLTSMISLDTFWTRTILIYHSCKSSGPILQPCKVLSILVHPFKRRCPYEKYGQVDRVIPV